MRPHPAAAATAAILAFSSPALAEPTAASLLFEAPALAEIASGTRLIYRLERVSNSGAGPHRTASIVELALQPEAATGPRQATVAIVTGERRQDAGTFPSVVGNPVILVVLERDVAEMSRILRASPHYIRNRIREALGESTPAEPVRFTLAGRDVEAWRVTVTPFAQDRNRDKLRDHAAKRYEFLVSDAVPGSLYEMRLTTPGPDGTTLVEDRLAFERLQPPGDGR